VWKLAAPSCELPARLGAAGACPADLAAPLTMDVDSTIVAVSGRRGSRPSERCGSSRSAPSTATSQAQHDHCRFDGGSGLRRLRTHPGLANYQANHDDDEDAILPDGAFAGTAEDAPDCAYGLHRNDATTWT